ncbi:MAG: cytochrome c4 [Burkholderiales bacterium]|nr:cytochrome c4 [Burkholderiales bacterium]
MKLRLALAAATFASAAAIGAESPPAAVPAKAQQTASEVCAACHGVDGNSPTPENPNLAGQIPEYMTKQLMNFKSPEGKKAERENAIMAGMVAALSPEDMRNLGAYYGAQRAKPGFATDTATVELGQRIYRAGIVEKGVPACSGCHGVTGLGLPMQYPRLAGQHTQYTVAQMQAWRTGARANDPNKMMRMIAAKMTDAEIKAVSDYIAGLR